VELTSWHIRRILNRFIEGQVTAKEVEDWANLVEGRDDIGFVSEEMLEAIHWLANPYLEGVVTEASAEEFVDRLPSYRHKVSLRIWHPTIDPAEITLALGITPQSTCRAGEPRTNPKGDLLRGNWKESHWSASFSAEKIRNDDLPGALTAALESLLPNRAFFQQIRATGGRVEFFVGWFFERPNVGEVLESRLLGRMAELGIDLSLDLYSAL
jgi:hypothetical protein